LKRKAHTCRTLDHSSSSCLLFHVVNNRLNYGSTFCSLALLLASLHVARCIVFCFFDPRSRWFTGAWQMNHGKATQGERAGHGGFCWEQSMHEGKRKYRSQLFRCSPPASNSTQQGRGGGWNMCKGNVEFSCRAAAPCIRRWLIINLKQREQSKYNYRLKRIAETSHKEAHQIQ
jgi:hypothetical protein